jgi:hypothetical protein
MHEAGRARRPHAAFAVLRHAHHGGAAIPGEPVLGRIEAREAAAVHADPHASVAVMRQRAHITHGQPVRIVRPRRIDPETIAIPTCHAILGTGPQIALGVFGDAGGDGVRQAVVLAEVLEHRVGHAAPADAGRRSRSRRRGRRGGDRASGRHPCTRREPPGQHQANAGAPARWHARVTRPDLIAAPATHSFALLACCPTAGCPNLRTGVWRCDPTRGHAARNEAHSVIVGAGAGN